MKKYYLKILSRHTINKVLEERKNGLKFREIAKKLKLHYHEVQLILDQRNKGKKGYSIATSTKRYYDRVAISMTRWMDKRGYNNKKERKKGKQEAIDMILKRRKTERNKLDKVEYQLRRTPFYKISKKLKLKRIQDRLYLRIEALRDILYLIETNE